MVTTNRVLAFYNDQKVVPYDEVNELMTDAWNDGFDDGYRNGKSFYVVVGVLGVVFGWLLKWVCS